MVATTHPASAEQIKLAYSIAATYQAYHPLLDPFEAKSIAGEVVAFMGNDSDKEIRDAVRNALWCELRRGIKRHQRFESIDFDEAGEPLNSALSLRAATSLNPPASRADGRPHPRGFMMALDAVCQSAALQAVSDPGYLGAAGLSRSLVKESQNERERARRMQQNEDLRRLKRAA